MFNPPPLVSIIMPAHDHAAFVEVALHSIAAQTHSRIEVIVIDDGSTDDTAQVIARSLAALAQTRTMRVVFQRQPNRGLGATLAHALTLAQGDYVQFLASDDALFPDMTARLVAAFAEVAMGRDVAAIACDGYVFDGVAGPHRVFSHLHPAPLGRNQHREMMAGNWLPAMGLLYRRDILLRAGGIDPDLAYEDWGLLLALTQGHRIAQIPDRLFLYRRHARNASADMARMKSALHALGARFPAMAQARDLRAALGARDPRGILRGLRPGNLDLAGRFLLREMQRALGRIRPVLGDPGRSFARPARGGMARIEIGPGCTIHPGARLEPGPGALVLGAGCHVGADARLIAGPGLTIGAGTIIEAGARIGGPQHPTRIGRACLIAAGARIAPGSRMGDICALMPQGVLCGPCPDGTWILPPGAGPIGAHPPQTELF